jgi:putative membrane protein
MNAETFLTEDERRLVEQAVGDVEKTTSAEVVCALATESGRYDRAESIVGLAGALVGLGVVQWLASGPIATEPGAWTVQKSVSLMGLALAVVLGFVAGTILASAWHGLRRLFTSSREMLDETERAAGHVFVSRRLASTRDRGGLLIYVSLAERLVVVLGDDGVMKAAGQPFLDGLRDLAVSRLREGKRVEAFTDTLKAAGEKLAGLIPLQKNDANELPNPLLVFRSRP